MDTLSRLEAERASAKLRAAAAIAVHDGVAAEAAQDEIDAINADIRRLCKQIEELDK